MIRGPVLPQARERLWSVVAPRLDLVEPGLVLVAEGFDCSDGHLGVVDGLARDALGAPVLVILAVEGDGLLAARTLGAAAFLDRVGGALAAAIPEANFVPGCRGRVVVVGAEAAATGIAALRHIAADNVHACVLEPFRIAGVERFAVRWLERSPVLPGSASPVSVAAAAEPAAAEFVVPEAHRRHWSLLGRICERLDPEVLLDGSRFSRRITWRGRPLASVLVEAEGLIGVGASGERSPLAHERDVRTFADGILRTYLAVRDPEVRPPSIDPTRSPSDSATGNPQGGSSSPATSRPLSRHALQNSLRSSLASARLSPEEYSALGGSTGPVGHGTGSSAAADDVARIVAAQERPWTPDSGLG